MAITNLTGTGWHFNDTISLPSTSITYKINFRSNGVSTYRSLVPDAGGISYIRDYAYTDVYSTTKGWITTNSRNFQDIVITGGTAVTNTDLISWLESNATQIQPISKTVWYFNSSLSLPSRIKKYNINFTATLGGNNYSFTELAPSSTYLTYTGDASAAVYNGSNNTWAVDSARTIVIIDGTDTVNGDLISWLESNATQLQVSDLTNTTWYFNSTVTGITYPDYVNAYLDFEVNNQTRHFIFGSSGVIQYSNVVDSRQTDIIQAYSNNWYNESYRTITITGGQDATNPDIIFWMLSNATQVENLRGTYWRFNSTLAEGWPDGDQDYSINFEVIAESGISSFTLILIEHLGRSVWFNDDESGYGWNVYYDGEWHHFPENFVIHFTGNVTNSDFISWLRENANLVYVAIVNCSAQPTNSGKIFINAEEITATKVYFFPESEDPPLVLNSQAVPITGTVFQNWLENNEVVSNSATYGFLPGKEIIVEDQSVTLTHQGSNFWYDLISGIESYDTWDYICANYDGQLISLPLYHGEQYSYGAPPTETGYDFTTYPINIEEKQDGDWEIHCSTGGTHTIGVYIQNPNESTTMNITAQFGYQYTYSVSYNSNYGTVTHSRDTSNANVINLSATPGSDYMLDGWYVNSERISTAATTTYTLTGDTIIEARFRDPYRITTNINGLGNVSYSRDATDKNDVTITASTIGISTFVRMEVVSQTSTQVYTMSTIRLYLTSDITVTAYFNMGYGAIYDRTQADVDRVRYLNRQLQLDQATQAEKNEWRSDLKGALNTSDLERVYQNITLLANELDVVLRPQILPPGAIANTDWYERLLENVNILREAWFVRSDTPATPTSPLNTYQKWNDIEKIIFDMMNLYVTSTLTYSYAGSELYGDDNNLI